VNKRVVAILLAGIIFSGMIYSHPAFAHNFGGDESASFIARNWELRAEMVGIEQDLSSQTDVSWHISKSGEYWNANDTREMGERNTLLAKEIPSTLSDIYTAANVTKPDPNVVKQKVDQLLGYLDEAIPVRIDKDKTQNATVQITAVNVMVRETLEHYGDALNSTFSLNDMSNMNATNMSGGSMSGMSAQTIVNNAAYTSAKLTAKYAQDYFDKNVKPLAPASSSVQVQKIDSTLMDLNQEIANKADPNSVMMTVHMQMHPAMITGFGLKEASVPEFPVPTLLVIISIVGVIMITRLRPQLRQ
jgi:hypothetical protein